MKAGKLDRRITILRNGPATDNGIEVVPGGLGIFHTCWADWKAAAGSEIFENMGREAKAGGYFYIRDSAKAKAISPLDYVVWDGRTYGVEANDPHDRNEKRRLTVTRNDEQDDIDIGGLAPIPAALQSATGWATYVHTGAAQNVAADTETALLNDAGQKLESQMPTDVVALYDGVVVTGREGDSIMVGVEFTFTPDDGAASMLRLSIDIGGAIGKLYPEEFPITSGAATEHKISYHPPAYTLDTWEANGGTLTVETDGPGVITGVRYVIHRLHKAR